MYNKVVVSFLIGASIVFSGCAAKGAICKNGESKVNIEVFAGGNGFGESPDNRIIKDRLNISSETVYNNNLNYDGIVMTADKSILGAVFTVSGLIGKNSIRLNKDKLTVELGEDVYKCDVELKKQMDNVIPNK